MVRLGTLFILVAVGLSSCSSAQRTPAQEMSYRTIESPVCDLVVGNTNTGGVNFSALNGMRVGPSARALDLKPGQPILRPFFSDGCSASPDGLIFAGGTKAWVHCCVAHDIPYWIGGTEEEKLQADQKLKSCIEETGNPVIAGAYFASVRSFGGPNSTMTYRWGYGWNEKRPFSELTAEEWRQIESYYPAPRETMPQRIFSETRQLVRTCGAEDPAARRALSFEERQVLDFLNVYLKRDAVIGWARPGFDGPQKWEYGIQFLGCDRPSIVSFPRNPGVSPVLKSECGF